ncbi:MAG TPA: tetratricopeptide repeat protein [Casimicrobiaceae bacterium]|nr:tetratricopeptide repeat protein [Casimicrobiaceae bacterium]
MNVPSTITTYLFTDIEGSTRLWEQEPERMRLALKRHDAIARRAVEEHAGTVVKTMGDGLHATFDDPLDAVSAAMELQQALSDANETEGIALRVRCGLHAGVDERRDRDFFGRAVNRAARIMSAAHGGQVLLSEAVAILVSGRLPAGVALRELGAVRLRDLASPDRIYQIVHPKLRQDFPALRSLEVTPNNLPVQLTSFIGREKEVEEVEKLLDQNRLVTLLGVGGIGKTRLSLQLAAGLMEDYPDGVWFVELAPVTDDALVAQAVASVVGVKEEAGRPVVEALVKCVQDRRLLIILDNCEHLIASCAELAKQILRAGRQLKVLASSREALHVAGEAIYAVPALAVPDPYHKFIHTALTQYAAARLFIDRAVAAQPAFALSERNATAVADVCQRLDGIPLAIELAAARVRAMSVEEIATRLTDRFRLLARGDRTALPRQQTLRALIDWSYDLLTESERTLFQRLSVFAGGWTLEAAEAVGAGGNLGAESVLELLTNLVEKSLAMLDPDRGRYRMLETVREYAQDRFSKTGEGPEVRTRHLDFYLALAEKARPELMGPQQATWLATLDLERENLLSAHTWCSSAESGAERGLRLTGATKQYWITRGLLGLGHRLCVEALARTASQDRTIERCLGLFHAGQVSSFMGSYEEACEYLEESLAIARELGDKRRIAGALQPLGMATLGLGKLTTARAYFEEALVLANEQNNARQLAGAINALAQLHRVEGNLDSAVKLYEKVIAIGNELGDHETTAIGLLNVAIVAVSRGARDEARKLLLDALAIASKIGSKPAGQSVVEVCAGLAVLRDDCEQAARFFGSAETQVSQTGLHRDPADEAFLSPLIARARDRISAAAFAAAESAGRELSYDEAIEEARSWLEGISRSKAKNRTASP